MQTTTLQEVLRKYPKVDAAELGKFLDELDKIPRRKKRRINVALPGTQHVRLVDSRLIDSDLDFCPQCLEEAYRRRLGCPGH